MLVSDVGMPETDGFALVRTIRKLDVAEAAALPAIAVTAYANPEDRVRALVAGYQNHIPKPVDANVLAAAIAVQLRARSETLPVSVALVESASPAAAAGPPGCRRDRDRRRRRGPGWSPSARRLPAAWPVFPFGVPGAGARAGASVARVSICSRSNCTTIARSCHNDPCHLPSSDSTPACSRG